MNKRGTMSEVLAALKTARISDKRRLAALTGRSEEATESALKRLVLRGDIIIVQSGIQGKRLTAYALAPQSADFLQVLRSFPS
jgi:aspartate aminotransferase-like enzyme